MSDTPSDQAVPVSAEDTWKMWLAAGTAIVLMLFYIFLVYQGWRSTGDVAEQWARKVFLLGGIEALAFGAAGWMFGKEVSRKTVEALEEKAAEAGAAAEKERGNVDSLSKELDSARSEATALAAALKMAVPDSAPTILSMGETAQETASGVGDLLNRADRVLELYGQSGDQA